MQCVERAVDLCNTTQSPVRRKMSYKRETQICVAGSAVTDCARRWTHWEAIKDPDVYSPLPRGFTIIGLWCSMWPGDLDFFQSLQVCSQDWESLNFILARCQLYNVNAGGWEFIQILKFKIREGSDYRNISSHRGSEFITPSIME